MDSGLLIVASDLDVHREICGDAAVYFPRFSTDALAQTVMHVADSREKAASMSREGIARAKTYSWESHVKQIVALARSLTNEKIA
jgi:glycosyltransferase involved in cell wall biosynthesis